MKWQRLRFSLMFLLICLSLFVYPVQADSGPNKGPLADYVSDQVVVQVNLVAGATIAAINADYGTTTIRPLLGSAGVYLLQTPAGQDAVAVADQLAVDLRLLFAEPNFINQVPEANPISIGAWGGADPVPFFDQYSVAMLNLARAHGISRGAGTVVAVLDTGVQLDHPALAAYLTANGYDFVDDDPVPEDELGGPDDLAGHGTHVAGIVHLVAPEAQIMPLRVLDRARRGDVFTLAEAMQYAIDQGADVINLSLGLAEESELLEEVTEAATRQGVVVVAAAGNLNTDAEQHPAALKCVLAVTAIGPESLKSEFANFGDWLALAAPGEGIYSPFPSDGYAWWSGTSMATPFAAGQAALLLSLEPSLTARDVARLMGGTAQSLDALNPGFVKQLGAGRLDIGLSLERLQADDLLEEADDLLKESCVGDDDDDDDD